MGSSEGLVIMSRYTLQRVTAGHLAGQVDPLLTREVTRSFPQVDMRFSGQRVKRVSYFSRLFLRNHVHLGELHILKPVLHIFSLRVRAAGLVERRDFRRWTVVFDNFYRFGLCGAFCILFPPRCSAQMLAILTSIWAGRPSGQSL